MSQIKNEILGYVYNGEVYCLQCAEAKLNDFQIKEADPIHENDSDLSMIDVCDNCDCYLG